jgi:hypothetical protein
MHIVAKTEKVVEKIGNQMDDVVEEGSKLGIRISLHAGQKKIMELIARPSAVVESLRKYASL